MKTCNKCGINLIVGETTTAGRMKNQTYQCKTCYNSYQRKSNKEKRYNLKWKYGISSYDYNLMLQKQNNKCAICNNLLTKPHVDHCHISNEVRGLLCFHCNTGLGKFQDDITILKNAIKYLQQFI